MQRRPAPDWSGPGLLQGGAPWRRRGIYLEPTCTEQEYGAVFSHYLAAGVLLAPEHHAVSILPAEGSPGEGARLRGLLNTPTEVLLRGDS